MISAEIKNMDAVCEIVDARSHRIIDGYIVKLDLPELREMISLLRRSSNNLNQIAKRLNETGRFYAADLEDMLRRQEQLWQTANRILSRLAMVG